MFRQNTENKNNFMFKNFFFRESCPLRDNVEKFGGARGATNDVTVRLIRVACWISNVTRARARTCTRPSRPGTHPHTRTDKYITLIPFPRQKSIRKRASLLRYSTLPVLLRHKLGGGTMSKV